MNLFFTFGYLKPTERKALVSVAFEQNTYIPRSKCVTSSGFESSLDGSAIADDVDGNDIAMLSVLGSSRCVSSLLKLSMQTGGVWSSVFSMIGIISDAGNV